MISEEGNVSLRESELPRGGSEAEERYGVSSLSGEYQERAGENLGTSAFLEEHLQVTTGSDDEDDALLDILSQSHACTDIGFAPYCLIHVHSYRMWPVESLGLSLSSTAENSEISSVVTSEEEEEEEGQEKRGYTSDGENGHSKALPGDSFLGEKERSQDGSHTGLSPGVPRRGSAGVVKYSESLSDWKSSLIPSWDALTMLDLTAVKEFSITGETAGEKTQSATTVVADNEKDASALTSRGATPGRQHASIHRARRLRSTSSPSVMLVRAPSPQIHSGRSKDSSSSALMSPGDPSTCGDTSTVFEDVDTSDTVRETSTACPLLFVTGDSTQRLITVSPLPSEGLTAELMGESSLVNFELLSPSAVFPELELLPNDITIVTTDVRYLSNSRVAAFGTSSGVLYVTQMAMELDGSSARLLFHQPSLLTSYLDGPISAVRWLPKESSDDNRGEQFLQRMRERKSRDAWEMPMSASERERSDANDEPLQLLVCGMVGFALLYTDIGSCGLRGAKVLPESDLFDTITCCHCGHVMLDGRDGPPDILLGTYGGDVLLYSSFPVEKDNKEVDSDDEDRVGEIEIDRAGMGYSKLRKETHEGEASDAENHMEGAREISGVDDAEKESCDGSEGDKDIWISRQDLEEEKRVEDRAKKTWEQEEEEEYQLVWSRNFLQPVMSISVGDYTSTGVDYIAVVTFSGLHLLRPSEEDLRSALSQSLALDARKRDLDLAIREELTSLEHLRQALAEAGQ